jgi:methyl-accepting chemotaxis protein
MNSERNISASSNENPELIVDLDYTRPSFKVQSAIDDIQDLRQDLLGKLETIDITRHDLQNDLDQCNEFIERMNLKFPEPAKTDKELAFQAEKRAQKAAFGNP